VEEHFEEIVSSAYSVSLFTDWRGEQVNQVWLKSKGDGASKELPADLFGAVPAQGDRHPIGGLSPEACTKQMGVVGRWYERLPHFRMEFTPSSGEELQSEYFVPRTHAVAAMRAIHAMRERLAPVVQTSEIRTIAADDLWMSPFNGRDSVALHFTWRKDWDRVKALLPLMEAQLAPFEPAPHWGKLFTMPARAVQARYAKRPQYQQLLRAYDPAGKFRNAFLDMYVFDEA
jgi:alditol oxidase